MAVGLGLERERDLLAAASRDVDEMRDVADEMLGNRLSRPSAQGLNVQGTVLTLPT